MPVAPTYPGVYIDEIPSGVRTITGVATSITAFVGPALRGPLNTPRTINSFGDYSRIFGGLASTSPMSYAVQDFFLNGGSQAVIARIAKGATPSSLSLATTATPAAPVTPLVLNAATEGIWGNSLRARVEIPVATDTSTIAAAAILGLMPADIFNLIIWDKGSGAIETYNNLSIKDSPRRVDLILAQQSALVRYASGIPVAPQIVIPNASAAPAAGKTIFQDDGAWTLVLVANQGTDSAALDAPAYQGDENLKTGLFALAKADLFNILCIPPPTFATDLFAAVWTTAAAYCIKRRAMLLIDAPLSWASKDNAKAGLNAIVNAVGSDSAKNTALYFPRIRRVSPDNQQIDYAPCGALAGIYSRTDSQRGVWKAPAGLEASLVNAPALSVPLNDPENGELNPIAVNCLRSMAAAGNVVWGARTLQGNDLLASEWKYVPIRRLALFIEESLFRGTQWAVFEPNDEPLWAQIRLNLGAFMQNLFRQGAFQGKSPREAYFVKCDSETTTQNDRNLGIVNIVVGFAPLKPAEFVIIHLQQIAGQIDA